MPPKPSIPIPTFYRLCFSAVDPLIALWGAYMNIFTPAVPIDAYVPSSMSPYQPLQSFMGHQVAGGLITCAIMDIFLLRKTNEVWIWRVQQWAQLAYDFVLIGSQFYSLNQQGRLNFANLRVEDYGCFGVTFVVTVVRILFLARVGMKRSALKRA